RNPEPGSGLALISIRAVNCLTIEFSIDKICYRLPDVVQFARIGLGQQLTNVLGESLVGSWTGRGHLLECLFYYTWANGQTARQQERFSYDIPQVTDIARPVLLLKQFNGIRCYYLPRCTKLLAVFPQKVLHQVRNVFPPFTQRRQTDAGDVQ